MKNFVDFFYRNFESKCDSYKCKKIIKKCKDCKLEYASDYNCRNCEVNKTLCENCRKPEVLKSKNLSEFRECEKGTKYEVITNLQNTIFTASWVTKTVNELLKIATEEQKKKLFEDLVDFEKNEILKDNLISCSKRERTWYDSKVCFESFFNLFFSNLKKNIFSFLPCDLEQSKTLKLVFLETLRNFTRRNTLILDSFEYFFKKSKKGIFEPSTEEMNKDIKNAFKEFNNNSKFKQKKISDLEAIIDTKKGNSLKNTSTAWKTIKKLFTSEKSIFDDLNLPSVYQYKANLFIYMELSNFYKELTKFISPLDFSQMIESLINYLKDESNLDELAPKNSTEFYLKSGYFTFMGIEETFFYERKNPEDMDNVLKYRHQKDYIETLVSQTKYYCLPFDYSIKTQKYDKQAVLFFIETLSSESKIGKSSEFFFKWATARLSYGEYKREINKNITSVSNNYMSAYESGLYYAGSYIKDFCQEAIEVFMLEWKENKKVNRIKEVYKFASALKITLQLYDAFKESGFNDYSIIHPDQFILNLWDIGYDLISITKFSGLPWQIVQRKLCENIKYLKRQDKAAIDEMQNTYISKWECDDYLIDTLEEFHD